MDKLTKAPYARSSGILLHPTSLPGRFGIGDLGEGAYRFADFLAGAKQHLWQMLPLGPTGYGDSPYQCLSAFAGNPMLISLDALVRDHLLDASDLAGVPPFPENIVDFAAVAAFKIPLLRKSFELFEAQAGDKSKEQFGSFCHENVHRLDEFALFMALREAHKLAAWNTWEEGLRDREPKIVRRWKREHEREVVYHQYLQFVFSRQWAELRKYCADRGIKLVGDIPIFVALDSTEVWAHREMFYLDERGQPTVVAGVPPDYFSKTGQLWSNPLYRWDVMAKNGFEWWMERLRATLSLVDMARIDHFRGFEKYWEIPAHDETAANGRWVEGPGAAFFESMAKAFGELPLIAEDLGLITPEVHALRERFGFPGMRVLQFAFMSGSADDHHLPHNYPRNCVVYTGTHDNNTTVGWFKGEGPQATTLSDEARTRERKQALKYLGTTGGGINWDLIRLAMMSVANTAIIPLQDVLGLGAKARMNTPGTRTGNWSWRFTASMLTDELRDRLADMTTVYGR
jgi:4-alpha-glucanotransferase